MANLIFNAASLFALLFQMAPVTSEPVVNEGDNICGQLTVATTLEYFGQGHLYDAVFRELPRDGQPKKLHDLREATRKLGLASAPVRWKKHSQIDLRSPAIIRLDPESSSNIGHFVIILAQDDDRMLILDPLRSTKWIASERIWNAWDGVALHINTDARHLPSVDTRIATRWSLLFLVLAFIAFLLSMHHRLPHYHARHEARHLAALWNVLLFASASIAVTLIASIIYNHNYSIQNLPPRNLITAIPYARVITLSNAKREDDGAILVHYSIRNFSSSPISIKEVYASCSCLTPRLSSHTIRPHSDVTLTTEISRQTLESSASGALNDIKFSLTLLFDDVSLEPIVVSGIVKR